MYLFVLRLLFSCLGTPRATLTSNPSLDVHITRCQPVQMTCRTQKLTVLSWFYDGVPIETFVYDDRTVTFPLRIHNEDGIVIEIMNAVSESDLSDMFNATSLLTTTTLALGMLNVDSITCGTRGTRSQTQDLTMLNIQGVSFISVQ